MHFYQFNIGDYLKHTAHLTPLEDIAYRRLLDMYYDTEQPIPLETQSVSRRLRLDIQTVESVLKEFFVESPDGWRNLRCDAEIKAYHVICERNRANGKLGGRKKKTQSVSFGNPDVTQIEANHEPLTINHKEKHINGSLPADAGIPNCPVEELVNTYHEVLPTLRRVAVLSEKRRTLARQRWRECFKDGDFTDQQTGIEAFKDYFKLVSRSDFLCGRVQSNRPFQADFEWLMNSSNFIKVIEGKYNGN